LLGTIGGLGSIFNLFASTWIRSYNRVSIFISFFSLFTVLMVLERLAGRWRRSHWSSILFAGLLLLLLAGGIWDQTCKSNVFRYRDWQKECANDAEFIGRIESCVPPSARIWQLPRMTYPEHGPVQRMDNFDHFRAYLHSKTLHWSFGAMRGSEGDRWQQEVASLPPVDMVRRLSEAGFSGIYLDRYGFPDRAVALEAELTALLHVPVLQSPNKRFSFFNMAEYNNCQERVQ
jgi:phosphoglycerol transferase